MKLLILGADGMLGHKLFQLLGKAHLDTYGTITGDEADLPFKHIPFFQTGKVFSSVDAMDFQYLENILSREFLVSLFTYWALQGLLLRSNLIFHQNQ